MECTQEQLNSLLKKYLENTMFTDASYVDF